MVHTRDTRASSSELKFMLDPALAPSIGRWLRSHLEPDPHGTGPFGDEYDTSSLYFDTATLDVFNRRGSFGRAKFRVRRYSPAGVVFLERKLRRPGLLVKRRSITALAELENLAAAEVDPGWDGAWFHRRMLFRHLRPVCQISFHRAARILACHDGVARATLDTDFSALPVGSVHFPTARGSEFLAGLAILELKFRGPGPVPFRRLIEEFALSPQAVSKYRLGMAALGHVPAAARPAASGTLGLSYA